jgi:hypothetical protein
MSNGGLFALARLDSLLREQCAIEEADDALFVLGGALVDRLGVVDVGEIPERGSRPRR